jgi:hypothetical protein
MLDDIDDKDKEPAQRRANRKWANHAVSKLFKEAQRIAAEAPKEPKKLEVADTIKNDEKLKGRLLRIQPKFAKDVRAMMEGHAQQNLVNYHISLMNRKRKLLAEKLRRLQLAEAQQENHNEHKSV